MTVAPIAVTELALNGAATITANVSQITIDVIIALWHRVNPYDPGQVADFKAKAGRIIISSQNTVAAAHTASQLMQLRALGIDYNPVVVIPDNVRGQSVTFGAEVQVHAAAEATVQYQEPVDPTQPEPRIVDQTVPQSDAEPQQIFDRAAETYRYEKSIGSDDVKANAAAETRIGQIVDDNLILAQRLAEQQTLSTVQNLDKRVHGYRRVIHPELSKGGVCGLCVAAASRRYFVNRLRPIHAHCKCSIAPITDRHDVGDLLNGKDLGKLYDHSGSTKGRDLKKTRYVVEHHNELGPVLTRVSGEKVPYYSTTPVELDKAVTALSPS